MDGAERLEELNGETLALLAEFEGRVGGLQRQLAALQHRLDIERGRLGAALEELGARYLVPQPPTSDRAASGAHLVPAPCSPVSGGPSGSRGPQAANGGGGENDEDAGLDLEMIRAAERALGEQLLGSVAFARKLDGLANLLLVSRSQFAPSGEAEGYPAPGDRPDLDAWKLATRIATIKAQEEERSRLAREVHDGPAQVLANAILGLELCEQIARRSPDQLIEEIGRLKAMVREGLVEVRRFIFDLRPSTLAERGLPATLQRYVADYRAFFRIEVELQLPPALPPLSQEQEITVFRIVQEALQNVQKHAQAGFVTVRLAVVEDALVVSIRDDGRGFALQQTEVTLLSGAGLRGMRERAAAVGGELPVESAPGAGTTVRLVLPLRGQSVDGSRQ